MKQFYEKHKKGIIAGAIIVFILLIIIGIIIFCFKHHSYTYSPNIADNIYNFLNEWALAIAPALTFLGIAAALYMSFRSLNQTKEIQEKEKRERLLKEIIEWAIDISKCGVEASFRDIMEITNIEANAIPFAAHIAELSLRFKAMSGNNQYISKIASTFGQVLQKVVGELTKEITFHIELLNQCTHNAFTESRDESAAKVNEHKLILYQSVNKVIEEAAKIKLELLK